MHYPIKDLLQKIDFGDIDGLYDPNIKEYFLDFGYWESIIKQDTFFVIGRKGTGKSAVYNWVYQKQFEENILVSNLSFKEFPFEKFLRLSDDDFSKPNQYQSIWRNIILSEIAKLIITDQKNEVDDSYKEIKNYVTYFFGKNVNDLHKEIARIASKTSTGIGLKIKSVIGIDAKHEWSEGVDLADGLGNITMINRQLQEIITNYLVAHNTSKYIIQFDQLDDNYTTYLDNQDYFQSIISLFKVVYDINQSFRQAGIPVKSIAYLRSDIYYSINSFDAESARWDQFKLNLNFAIINKTDWHNPKLLKIINKRIERSLPDLSATNKFNTIFDNSIINLRDYGKHISVFRYMIHRTFHRPRDLIQFCIKTKDEAKKSDSLFFRTIKNAEKEYSLWLLSEVSNEIAPKVNDIDSLYELLRLMGKRSYSITDFRNRYNRYKTSIGVDDHEELLRILYGFGIINNISFKNRRVEMYSITRNDRSVFNRDLKIETHAGFYQGLYTSKFLSR